MAKRRKPVMRQSYEVYASCFLLFPNIFCFNIKFLLKLIKSTIFVKVRMMENTLDFFLNIMY